MRDYDEVIAFYTQKVGSNWSRTRTSRSRISVGSFVARAGSSGASLHFDRLRRAHGGLSCSVTVTVANPGAVRTDRRTAPPRSSLPVGHDAELVVDEREQGVQPDGRRGRPPSAIR